MARYVRRVFDEGPIDSDSEFVAPDGCDRQRETYVINETPGRRKQLQLQVVREAGNVREILLQKVPAEGRDGKLETLLKLGRTDSMRLINTIAALPAFIPGDDGEVNRYHDSALRSLASGQDQFRSLYDQNPEAFRALIEADHSARDVVAIAHRRQVVKRFRALVDSPDAFAEAEMDSPGNGPEAVWQSFFEANPWVLGVGLSGQLLTSWSSSRLEQVVSGFSIDGPGKRADGLLRTNGKIRSLVFAEFKHHNTTLVSKEYRPGCWSPSPELVGGVVQAQQTVQAALKEIGDELRERDAEGFETGETTYLVRPRSFLVVGNLGQLRAEAGVHPAKLRSFELFRRSLGEPDIITFDELLARAEAQVEASLELEENPLVRAPASEA